MTRISPELFGEFARLNFSLEEALGMPTNNEYSPIRDYNRALWDLQTKRALAGELVAAYEAVEQHLHDIHRKVGLAVAAGHVIAQTAYNEAREAEAKLAQEKP